MSDRNDAEWVKESVIEDARKGSTTSVSGAWAAIEHPNGDIGVYKHTETVSE